MKLVHNILSTSGRPWVIHPAGQQPVYFDYNSVGDNTKVYSSVTNDWERNYTYDMLGRRLTYQEGELVESLTYNGGNLSAHSQSWLENGTAQTKTTTYHYNAHRLDSVSYEDALTTIYHYDQYGRVDSLYDESGVMCYEYGNMGEITKETRIYALPFLNSPLALTTQFRYDSWGRVDSIYYPDGERLNYQYDLGGQLQSISNNSSNTYLDNVTYDKFGAKMSQTYGNGLVTDYDYDNTNRRLTGITTINGNSTVSSIGYFYDRAGNVIQVNSTCPWLNNPPFTEDFAYDASDQLVSASETNSSSYSLSVTYGNWGKINSYNLAQTDLQNNTTQSETQAYTYPVFGNPADRQTLFAPEQRTVTDANNSVATETLSFGINGSLRRREVQSDHTTFTEYYLFNSAANLKAYSYDGLDFAYYGYNASNTRTYKLSMLNMNQWVNGQPQPLNLQMQSAMFYPNAYLNVNHNGEYTKHYYNGSERIASRLGEDNLSIAFDYDDMLEIRKNELDERFRVDMRDLLNEAVDVENPPMLGISFLQQTGNPTDVFYYHPNHLGSTAFVTDENATVTQGFLYAPFGEITTEYAPLWQNGTLPKYSFNAKELDEETGMYYYEARYYKPPVFTSRDPMMDQKPWLTPYHYCSNNPIGRVDPNGKMDDDTWVKTGDGRFVYNSEVNNDADAVEIYGTGSKSLADGTKCRTNKGNSCTLAKEGFYLNGEFHKVNDDGSVLKKIGKAIKKFDEGGHADPANTGRITQQDLKVGTAVLGVASGIGILAEGTLSLCGYVFISFGMANNIDNLFTNSSGKSGLQQLAGKNETVVNAMGYGKDCISLINMGYDFLTPMKVVQSPFIFVNTTSDVTSVGIGVTECVNKKTNTP